MFKSPQVKRAFVIGVAMATLMIAVWLVRVRSSAMSSVSVRDVRQAESLVLGQLTGNATVFAMTVRGSGEIDGEATISLLLNGEPFEVEQLSGDIDFEWRGDWYAETADIRYEPTGVRSGNLTLMYMFHQ